MRLIHTLIILCLILTVACHRQEHDPRLVRAADLAEHSYNEALVALDSIDPSALSDADRHFRDLLIIKAKDKNYVKHTSDSLILDVLSYYDRHKDDPYYPEALYYGGRVYSDMGDYPTSLTYFQRAVDELHDYNNNLPLKSHVLSQMARLLTNLRLYNEAIPYIKESIDVDSILNDSVNFVYDLQLLGGIHLLKKNYGTAEEYLKTALKKGINLPQHINAKTKMHLAGVKHFKGEIDSALLFIRHTPELVSPVSRNTALSYATQIYCDAGIKDTAYMYAQALVLSKENSNKRNGYHMLLSPDLRDFVNVDSIIQYAHEYRNIVDARFNDNQNQLTITQQSHYNYRIHEREKAKAIKDKSKLIILPITAALLIAVLVAFLFFFKYRNQKQIIRLQQALETINRLKLEYKEADVIGITPADIVAEDNLTDEKEATELVHSDSSDSKADPIIEAHTIPYEQKIPETSIKSIADANTSFKPSMEALKEKLKNEILCLSKTKTKKNVPKVSEIILNSEIYLTFQKRFQEGKVVRESDSLWFDLHKLVTEAHPYFIVSIHHLIQKKLTPADLHLMLLLKCGFRTSEITILLGVSNGAVNSRRIGLGSKVFGEKVSANFIDRIIELL